jgi:hypothetical protein
MKYAIEMGSGGMLKIGSGIQKLLWGIHIETHRQHANIIGLLLFFLEK